MSASGAAAGAAPSPDPSASHQSASASGHSLTLSAFWQQYAFSVGGIDFLQIDVALAAMVFGDWARFEKRLAEGLACATRASVENLPVPTSAVDEAAISFRYERDLISGADITAWLDRAGFSPDARVREFADGRPLRAQETRWLGRQSQTRTRGAAYYPRPRHLCGGTLLENLRQSIS